MSKFYGTVVGSANTPATRRGFEDIKVCAQSWEGSVITRMIYDKDGNLIVEIQVSDDSSTYGRTVFYGTLDEFKTALSKR